MPLGCSTFQFCSPSTNLYSCIFSNSAHLVSPWAHWMGLTTTSHPRLSMQSNLFLATGDALTY
jgi:hypothetical protein